MPAAGERRLSRLAADRELDRSRDELAGAFLLLDLDPLGLAVNLLLHGHGHLLARDELDLAVRAVGAVLAGGPRRAADRAGRCTVRGVADDRILRADGDDVAAVDRAQPDSVA